MDNDQFGKKTLMLVWEVNTVSALYEHIEHLFELGYTFPKFNSRQMHYFIQRLIQNNEHIMVQHFLNGGTFRIQAYRKDSLHIRFVGGKHNANNKSQTHTG